MRSDLVAAPAQQMEACLVDIIMDVFIGDSDVFLGEQTFVTSNETKYLGVVSEQAVNDVVATWTLPTVEANTDFNLFVVGLGPLRPEGNNLVTLLR